MPNITVEETQVSTKKKLQKGETFFSYLMGFLLRIQNYIGKVESVTLVICLIAMSILVSLLMFGRYLKTPFPWAKEGAQYFLVYLAFIGASKGAGTESHVGTVIFLRFLPEKRQRFFSYLGPICFLAFGVIFGIISLKFVVFTHMLHRTTSTIPFKIPFEFILLPLPISFFTIAIHTFINGMKKVLMPKLMNE